MRVVDEFSKLRAIIMEITTAELSRTCEDPVPAGATICFEMQRSYFRNVMDNTDK